MNGTSRHAKRQSSLNEQVASELESAADLLEREGVNPFRIQDFRQAARSVARLGRDLREVVVDDGYEGLLAIPHVDRGIAAAIMELMVTGGWARLARLRGVADSKSGVAGAAGVATRYLGNKGPSVATLLHVDREYRAKAESCRLPAVLPCSADARTASPVPVLHTQREGWYFTALYSSSACARERHQIHDWVVIYYYDGAGGEGQVTIVSDTRGPLLGKRVVRGCEEASPPHYALDEDGPRFPACRQGSFPATDGISVV